MGLQSLQFCIAADKSGYKWPLSIGLLRRLNGCVFGGLPGWCTRHACAVGGAVVPHSDCRAVAVGLW